MAMKSVFKIFFLIILTFCYVNTVFEFSENEKKANFENESHSYIIEDNSNTKTFLEKSVTHLDTILNIPNQINFSINFVGFSNFSFLQECFYSPAKLYLLYSSLLYFD